MYRFGRKSLRIKTMSAEARACWLVGGVVVLAGLVRIWWSMEAGRGFLWGPDSRNYHEAAVAMVRHGAFSGEIPNVPYWPMGYPAFLSAAYRMFADGPRAVAVIQAAAVTVAAIAVFSTRRFFGTAVAGLAAVLISVNTALFGATSFAMYESLLAGLLALGIALILRRNTIQSALGFALLGLASIIQPKVLLVGALVLIWFALRRRRIAIALCVLTFLLAPTAVAFVNRTTYGSWALSANLGPTMRVGFNDQADGTYNDYTDATRRGCLEPDDLFESDRSMIGCAAGWAIRNPLRLPGLTVMKAMAFWSPLSGPLVLRSTWGSPIDLRLRYPLWWTGSPMFSAADHLWGHLFTLLSMALATLGAALLVRKERDAALCWLIPVVVFFLVSLATIGDARFRLPVAPFYLVFQAQGLIAVISYALRHSPTWQTRVAPSTHGSVAGADIVGRR